MYSLYAFFLTLCGSFCPASLSLLVAADAPLLQPVPPPSAPALDETASFSYEASFFKMLLTLLGLLVLIIVTVWFLRRVSQGQFRKGSKEQAIQILEKRPLSAKSMLYLIEIDQKQILISESQLEVRVIHDESSLRPEPE